MWSTRSKAFWIKIATRCSTISNVCCTTVKIRFCRRCGPKAKRVSHLSLVVRWRPERSFATRWSACRIFSRPKFDSDQTSSSLSMEVFFSFSNRFMFVASNRTTRSRRICSINDGSNIKSRISVCWENVRVRRAGFCHRAPYDRFVQRSVDDDGNEGSRSHVSRSNIFSYKIIDSVRTKLYPRGTLNRDSAAYICQQLNLDNDVAYGKTKLFIKHPWELEWRFSCHAKFVGTFSLEFLCFNWKRNEATVYNSSSSFCKR